MITEEELRRKRLTVGELKKILERYKVPDDALITCQSDEEGNRDTVCDACWVDLVGRRESEKVDGKWYDYVAGEDVIGFDNDKDKGRVFITLHPMY